MTEVKQGLSAGEWQRRAEQAESVLARIARMIEADGRYVESLERSIEIMLNKLEVAMRCW